MIRVNFKKLLLDYSLSEKRESYKLGGEIIDAFYDVVGKTYAPISDDNFHIFSHFLKIAHMKGASYRLFRDLGSVNSRYLYLFLSLCDDEQINKIVRTEGLLDKYVCDIITSRKIVIESKNDPVVVQRYGLTLLRLEILNNDSDLEEWLIDMVVDGILNEKITISSYVDEMYSGNLTFFRRLNKVLDMIGNKRSISELFIKRSDVLYENRNNSHSRSFGKLTPRERDFKDEFYLVQRELKRYTREKIEHENSSYPFITEKHEDLNAYYSRYLTKSQESRLDKYLETLVLPITSYITVEDNEELIMFIDYLDYSNYKKFPLLGLDSRGFFQSFFDENDTVDQKASMLIAINQTEEQSNFVHRLTKVSTGSLQASRFLKNIRFDVYHSDALLSILKIGEIRDLNQPELFEKIVDNPKLFQFGFSINHTREVMFSISKIYKENPDLDRGLFTKLFLSIDYKNSDCIFFYDTIVEFLDCIPQETLKYLEKIDVLKY